MRKWSEKQNYKQDKCTGSQKLDKTTKEGHLHGYNKISGFKMLLTPNLIFVSAIFGVFWVEWEYIFTKKKFQE